MKDKTFIFILIIISILIIGGFTSYKLIQKNKIVKNSLPYFTVGEKINYFDLISESGDSIDVSALKENKPVLIFIFPTPCSSCDRNLAIWKKITAFLENGIDVYGIILNEMSEVVNLRDKKSPNFSLYVPLQLDEFLEKFRIKSNLPQTILYDKGVRFLVLGELEPTDAKNLIKLGREII